MAEVMARAGRHSNPATTSEIKKRIFLMSTQLRRLRCRAESVSFIYSNKKRPGKKRRIAGPLVRPIRPDPPTGCRSGVPEDRHNRRVPRSYSCRPIGSVSQRRRAGRIAFSRTSAPGLTNRLSVPRGSHKRNPRRHRIALNPRPLTPGRRILRTGPRTAARRPRATGRAMRAIRRKREIPPGQKPARRPPSGLVRSRHFCLPAACRPTVHRFPPRIVHIHQVPILRGIGFALVDVACSRWSPCRIDRERPARGAQFGHQR